MTATKLRALVIDDELLARRRLIAMLADERDVDVIGEADSGSSAVQAIVERRPDLVFLDVQMPGLDGFGVLRCTAGAHRPVVVFVTAYDEYALRAFEVHAADYLLKPVTAARLHEAVRHARARSTSEPIRATEPTSIEALLASIPPTPANVARIPIRNVGGTDFVNVADVDWVEADGDHLRIHTGHGIHRVRETIAELETRLKPFRFMRVHRSAIVNVDAVRTVEPISKGDYRLVLRDGASVRSGRRYRGDVQSLIR